MNSLIKLKSMNQNDVFIMDDFLISDPVINNVKRKQKICHLLEILRQPDEDFASRAKALIKYHQYLIKFDKRRNFRTFLRVYKFDSFYTYNVSVDLDGNLSNLQLDKFRKKRGPNFPGKITNIGDNKWKVLDIFTLQEHTITL